MNESSTNPNEQKPVAFCQHCGKPLNNETVRRVGSAVYCEPCLEARLSGNPAVDPAAASPGYSPVNPGAPGGPGAWPGVSAATPNPGLAALLGFIPGVGAMYNEQYAKGIVHLLIFAMLVSLSNASGLFGILVFGWVIYMVIEAHHTARARRDGTPLPNPFGLNEVGDRLGFGRAWPTGPDVVGVAHDAAQAAAQAASGFRSSAPPASPGYPPTGAPPNPAQAAANWGAPADVYSAYPPYGQAANPYSQTANPGYTPVAGYPPYPTPGQPLEHSTRPRFPAGAVWLIGLGTIFLLATTGIFQGFPVHLLIGPLLIGVGAWIFVQRMRVSGASLTDDGTPQYGMRVGRALRVAIWPALGGLLFLLNSLNILSFRRSWPLLIIAAGVVALLERTAGSPTYPGVAGYAPVPPPDYPAAGTPASLTSLVPFGQERGLTDRELDQEGR